MIWGVCLERRPTPHESKGQLSQQRKRCPDLWRNKKVDERAFESEDFKKKASSCTRFEYKRGKCLGDSL